MRPGMRLGEALATCPELVLVERDPAAAEQEWEGVHRRSRTPALRSTVASLAAPLRDGGVERLYGGLDPAFERALAAVGLGLGSLCGRGGAALHRARGGQVARPGQASSSPTTARRTSWLRSRSAPPARARRPRTSCARSASAASASLRRFPALRWPSGSGRKGGGPGARAGGGGPACAVVARRRSSPRRSNSPRRSATSSRCAARWRRSSSGRSPGPTGTPASSAAGARGESRRRRLLAAHAHAARALGRSATASASPSAPSSPSCPRRSSRCGSSSSSSPRPPAPARARPARGGRPPGRLREGLRQVRASTGGGGVCTVVEVAPWSRIPEARALFVPRDEMNRMVRSGRGQEAGGYWGEERPRFGRAGRASATRY